MAHVQSTPQLKITLTPLRIADVAPEDIVAASTPGLAIEPTANPEDLVIYPGEPSEMLMQVKNLGTRSTALSLKVEGNFPPDWCQLGTEGREVLPNAQMDAVLYFQIPATFFEDQTALQPGWQEQLTLKYHVLITAEARTETGSEVQHIEFNLYVRPRSLYLTFLPALYRVDLMSRFLKIFEQAFEPAVQSLDVMWANLDPLTAPQSLLPFLAHWVGWAIEPGWNINLQRRLIRQAVELYRWRGTRKGLRLYLHWYTGLPLDDHLRESEKHISITEPFGPGFILGDAILAETAVLGGGQSYHFCVHLRAPADYPADRIDETILHRIIAQEKPAFCTYDLQIETPN